MKIIANLTNLVKKFNYKFFRGTGNLYEHTRRGGHNAPPARNVNFGFDELVSLAELETLRSAARVIYANFPIVSGAITEKADTSVGDQWIPIYKGVDKDWGMQATEFLREYFKVLDVRGGVFDFTRILWLGSISLDRDGEFFILPIRNRRTGWPSFQFLEAHDVGTRGHSSDETLYADRQWTFCNGRWVNSAGRTMAYRVLGKTPDQDRVVPARNMIHVYRPYWFSQGRGVSSIVFGLSGWLDSKIFHDHTRTALKAHSALVLINENETGEVDDTYEQISGITKNNFEGEEKKLAVEEYLEGTIKYIASGEALKAHSYSTPPNQAREFIEHIMQGAMIGLNWSYEQAANMGKLSAPAVRAMTAKCERAIKARQKDLEFAARKIVTFALSSAALGGYIPPLPRDFYKWTFSVPPKMSVDTFREAAEQREDLKAGLITYEEHYANRGRWYVDEFDQRFKEESYIDEKVAETGIPMQRIRMLGANDSFNDQQEQEQEQEEPADE